MLAAVTCAFVIATLAGMRLRYAPGVRSLFPPTCIYIPEGEVVPTLAVFLLASGAMITALVSLLIQSQRIRSLAIGLLVASLAFGLGIIANSAI